MMHLANRPMMEHIVQLLQRHGFDDIVVTVAFMANNIRSYFGDGSEFGVRMVYATEETPLGTAGSVRNAMDELDERFLVIHLMIAGRLRWRPPGRKLPGKLALAALGFSHGTLFLSEAGTTRRASVAAYRLCARCDIRSATFRWGASAAFSTAPPTTS